MISNEVNELLQNYTTIFWKVRDLESVPDEVRVKVSIQQKERWIGISKALGNQQLTDYFGVLDAETYELVVCQELCKFSGWSGS